MSTPRPTPETDAKASPHIGFYSCATVPADFARRLERERDEARDQAQAMREAIREVSLQLTFAEKVSGASVLHIYVYDALTKLQPFIKEP
jgi:hypothetical protein